MSFQLSSGVDGDKIFLVNRSELEGRLDVAFNLALIKNKIISTFPKIKLGKISHSYSGGTPSKAKPEYWKGSIPWVSPKDMKAFYLSESIDHITKEAILESSTNLIPKNSMLIVVRSGILQHTIPVAITTKDMAINQDIKALVFNEKVLPEYPAYFIDVFQSKILPLVVKHSTTVQSINTDQFDKLAIPIPPKNTQAKIVTKMAKAYEDKKQKEAQAKQLLNSIDDYLLKELGISLPKQTENTLKSRIFTRQLSEVSGGRLDPNYHRKMKLLFDQSTKYNYIALKELLYQPPQYGANEPAIVGNKKTDTRYIRITDISDIGVLKSTSWKTAEAVEDHYLLNKNDLLFARSGSVGRAYLHKETQAPAIFAGYLIRFILDESKADPNYVFYYCHSIIYKMWVDAIYRPAVQSNINAEEYKSLPVALPPIKKQTEIAQHISKIRQQAKQLQQQAKADLAQAKQEVEAMILGEA